MRSYLSGRRINITLIFMSSSSYLVHAISCRRILLKYRFFCNFCYCFSFFGFPFLFLFLFFKAWPTTRHPLPVTRYPPPVTRHPSPVTRHPRKSPAVRLLEVEHSIGDQKLKWTYEDRTPRHSNDSPVYSMGCCISTVSCSNQFK